MLMLSIWVNSSIGRTVGLCLSLLPMMRSLAKFFPQLLLLKEVDLQKTKTFLELRAKPTKSIKIKTNS